MRASQFNHKYDAAAKQMLAVLIGASAASQTGKNARCWTFATDELQTKTGASYFPGAYKTATAGYDSGDRRASISVTTSVTLASGNITTLVDGANNTGLYFGNTTVAAKEVRFQFAAPKIISEITWTQDRIASQGVWKVQGSGNGTDWIDLSSDFILGGGLTTTIYLSSSANPYLYVRFYGVSGNTTTSPYLYEVNFKIVTPGDSTLVPSPIAVSSAPMRMTIYLLAQPLETITLNTDLKVEVSRDGGTTWSGYGNLRLVEAYDATYNLYKADFTAAILPATGTSLLWRLTSYNDKQINVRGAALFWEL